MHLECRERTFARDRLAAGLESAGVTPEFLRANDGPSGAFSAVAAEMERLRT
jgi:hypothetical protein